MRASRKRAAFVSLILLFVIVALISLSGKISTISTLLYENDPQQQQQQQQHSSAVHHTTEKGGQQHDFANHTTIKTGVTAVTTSSSKSTANKGLSSKDDEEQRIRTIPSNDSVTANYRVVSLRLQSTTHVSSTINTTGSHSAGNNKNENHENNSNKERTDEDTQRPNQQDEREDDKGDDNDNGETRDTTNQPYRPHILLVIMDDMGPYDLGMHGTGIKTDVADGLARDGLYLQNYYVHPICTPTRVALLTGRFPHVQVLYEALLHHHTVAMNAKYETLPHVLGRAGYRSHLVGKWHVGASTYKHTPTFRGFDTFFGFAHNGMQDHFKHTQQSASMAKGIPDVYDMMYQKQPNCGPGCAEIVNEIGNYSSTIFARESIRIIREHSSHDQYKEQPLFLVLSYAAVHAPIQVPKEYLTMYQHMKGGLWDDKRRKLYASMLTAADDSLRDVIQSLKDTKMWEDTLVIYTSDNGAPPNGKTGSSNYPRRGYKMHVWEGGIAVDGIISGPARETLGIQNGTYPHLMHVVDWLPTLAEMVHVKPLGKPREPVDGVSHYSKLREQRFNMNTGSSNNNSDVNVNDNPIPIPRREMFLGFDGVTEQVAHRRDQYKLIWDFKVNNNTQLYDIENDPSERSDLSDLYRNITNELTRTVERTMLPRFKKGLRISYKQCCNLSFTKRPWHQYICTPWCGNLATQELRDNDECVE